MRSLKKVLALGLALVMAMGLMLSAGAFSDDSKIKNVDAVKLLTELSILSGFPDGSYRPEGNVTRAQMAKMTYVALRKGVDDKGTPFTTSSVPLSDLNGHWAKGYINFSYGAGIISGFPNGTFMPDANVTGYQAAKMLLTALGYSSTTEGYVGTGWDFRVAVDAASAGLLEDIEDVDLSTPLTRDNAAQMLYNTVFANLVTYDDGVLTEGDTFAEVKLGLVELTGILKANDIASIEGSVADEGEYVLHADKEFVDDETDFDDAKLTITGNADLSLLGQYVTAYVKTKSGADNEKLRSKDIVKTYGKVIATPDKNNVFTYYGKDYDPDDDYELEDDVLYSVDYAALTDEQPTAKKGYKSIFIDNDDDDKFEYVIVLKQVYSEADVRSSGEKIKASGLIGSSTDVDDVYGAKDVKDGDKILGHEIKSSGASYKYAVYAAPSFAGTLTAKTSGDALKISGSNYTLSEIDGSISTDGVTVDSIYDNKDNRNSELTYYTDGKYIVDYSGEDDDTPDNYAAIRAVKVNDGYADDVGTFEDSHQVAVTLEDGTEAIYDLADAEDEDGDPIAADELISYYSGKIASYDLDSKNKEIELGPVVTEGSSSSAYTSGRTSIRVNSTAYTVTARSIIFVRETSSANDHDFTVHVGKAKIPGIDADGVKGIAVNDDKEVLALLADEADVDDAGDDGNYAVLMDFTKLYDDDDEIYYELSLYEGGEKLVTKNTAIKDDFDGSFSDLKKGVVIDYTVSGDEITDIDYPAINDLSSPALADDEIEFYGGYVVKYVEGDYVTLRTGGTDAEDESTDFIFDFASDGYVVDLVKADSDSEPDLDVDPTLDEDDIEDKEADEYNVIVHVDDGEVVAVYYFSDDDYDHLTIS